MKVLLVNKYLYLKGGSEKYVFTLADVFKAAGHQVIFFGMESSKNRVFNDPVYTIPYAGIDGNLPQRFRMAFDNKYSKVAYRRMNELLDKEKPDLAILNLVHKQITLSILDALKEHHVKIIWTMHDLIAVCPAYTMLDGNGCICQKCLDGNFHHCVENHCVHGSKLMSVLSEREADYIRKKNWYNEVDTYICPSEFYKDLLVKSHFTNSKLVCMRNPLPLDTKYQLHFDETKKYFLFLGRLSKEKGISALIRAMRNVDYHLIILGTGPLEAELNQQILSEGLSTKISLLGFKQGSELQNYINGARAVVLPSEWYENGPYSAMEAMAQGKPLIVSSCGGLPELIFKKTNGMIFDSQAGLEDCLIRMASLKDEEYKKMCASSMRLAEKLFDPNNYLQNIMAL